MLKDTRIFKTQLACLNNPNRNPTTKLTPTQKLYIHLGYYDPAIGRFINADGLVSTGQGVLGGNMFAYCGNNPANYSDPHGNCFVRTNFNIATTMANIVVGAILAPFIELINNDNSNAGFDGHSGDGRLTEQQKNDNAEFVYDYLKEKGWSDNAIFAVLGNMEHESYDINPGKWQDGGGSGYGIVQWDPASKYLGWAAANGYAADSLTGQLEFLIYSMQPGRGEWFDNPNHPGYYLSSSAFISSTASVEYLTTVFMWSYERPGAPHLDRRINNALGWESYFRG